MRQFNGIIKGKSLNDFNKFDTGLDKYKDRLEYVNENINGEDGQLHGFFTEFMSKYYDVSPRQDGFLSEETSVFKLLERLGTFLIESKDTESHRKVEYKFWIDEREYNKSKESDNVNTSALSGNNVGSNVEVIDMFIDRKNRQNEKIVKGTSINIKDLREIEDIKLLQDAIDYLKSTNGIKDIKKHVKTMLDSDNTNVEFCSKLRYIEKNTERYVSNYVKALKDNQIMIKESIKRPIKFKNPLKDEGVANKLDVVDFDNVDIVKELLKTLGLEEDLMSDIGIISYDFKKLVGEVPNFKADELRVLDFFRKGFSQKEMVDIMGVDRYVVTRIIKRISKDIVDYYVNKKVKF